MPLFNVPELLLGNKQLEALFHFTDLKLITR